MSQRDAREASWQRHGARLRSRLGANLRDDSGAALVEFLGVTVLILVPIVYVVIAASQIQAATFAVEGASRAAARAAVIAGMDVLDEGGSTADAQAAGAARATAAVGMAFEDFSVGGDPAVALECDGGPCFEAGSAVSVSVSVEVALPGVPAAVVEVVPMSVDVTAVGRSPVGGAAP